MLTRLTDTCIYIFTVKLWFYLSEGHINFTINTNLTWKDIHNTKGNVGFGGRWSPAECQARTRVAIIVPCRDREGHLKVFLAHMHPILQRQLLDYQIFVVEQVYTYAYIDL